MLEGTLGARRRRCAVRAPCGKVHTSRARVPLLIAGAVAWQWHPQRAEINARVARLCGGVHDDSLGFLNPLADACRGRDGAVGLFCGAL